MADAAQDDPEIGAFARRRAPRGGLGGRAAEQPVRQRVEFGGDVFENVGEAIGDRVHQPGKDRSAAQRVALGRQVAIGERRERAQLLETAP